MNFIFTFYCLLQLGPDEYPHLRVQISSEAENYMPETSIVVDPRQSFDGSIRTLGSSHYSPRRSESSCEENYIQVADFEVNSHPDGTPIRPMIRVTELSETDSCHDWDDVDEKSNGTSHELCKVVRCIESEDLISKVYVESYCSSPDTKIRVPSHAVFHEDRIENEDMISPKMEYMSPKSNRDRKITSIKEDGEVELSLEEDEIGQPQEDRKSESKSPNKNDYLLEFPQSFKLPKSRSCNEGIHATWLDKLENNTPPNGYEQCYTGRPLAFPIKSCTFNNGVEFEKGTTIDHNGDGAEKKISIEEEDSSIISSLTSATKEPTAEAQDDKQFEDTQVSLCYI